MPCSFHRVAGAGSIRVIDPAAFSPARFHEALEGAGIRVLSETTVSCCVGPAARVHELATRHGTIRVHAQYEDLESGVVIEADEAALARRIYRALRDSPHFREVELPRPGS